MINNDKDASNIVLKRLNQNNILENEYNLLSSILLLMNKYSFVDNQTYPRPYHPLEKKRKDAYFTLIAIILSLRTTLENEQKAVNYFIEKYNSIDDVIKSDVSEIADIITCAGMPMKKAQTIMNISNYIIDNYYGNINNINTGNIEETREKLMKIPGVGEKSADCMLELAFNLPSIVVDINMFRVISRIYLNEMNLSFNNKKDILRVKKFLEENLVSDYRIYQIVHTIFLLHGKYTCKSNPKCDICELKNNCKHYLDKSDNIQMSLFEM